MSPAVSGRNLSPLEGVVDLIDRARSLNFVVMADIVGPLSEGALRGALDRVQQVHPLLSVRIVRDGPRAAFTTEGVGPIPLRRLQGDASDAAAEAEREMNLALPRETGPLLRCTWMARKGDADRSFLLLTFNHTIGDGSSGAYLLRDIVSLAGGAVGPAVHALPEPLESHMPAAARGLRGLFRLLRFLTRELWGWLWHGGIPRRVRHEQQVAVEDVRARLVQKTVAGPLLERLRQVSRTKGTSVHGALTAALMLAYLTCEEGKRSSVLCMGSPVDLRQRMAPPVGDDVGLFVSIAQSTHRVAANTDFWELARAARAALVASIERQDPFCFAPMVGWLVPKLDRWLGGPDAPQRVARFASKMVNATTGITNLGVLAIEPKHGVLRIERVQFTVSPSAMADLVCTAATFGGVLCWNFVYNAPRLGASRVEALAAEALSRLVDAVGEVA